MMIWNRIEAGFQWLTNKLFGKSKELPFVTGYVQFEVVGEKDFLLKTIGPFAGTKRNEKRIRREIVKAGQEWVAFQETEAWPVRFWKGWFEYRQEKPEGPSMGMIRGYRKDEDENGR